MKIRFLTFALKWVTRLAGKLGVALGRELLGDEPPPSFKPPAVDPAEKDELYGCTSWRG